MSISTDELKKLRQQEYDLNLVLNQLRREIYQTSDEALPELLTALKKTEAELVKVSNEIAKAETDDPQGGLIVDTEKETKLLGTDTTGLDVKVHLRMAHVPTGTCHLLNKEEHPLVSCTVRNAWNNGDRRLRMISFIDGYSARSVDTLELRPKQTHDIQQLPTLFVDRIQNLSELTRATLNILVEDLDGRVELHVTEPIWLLARNAAPLYLKDPKLGEWKDMTHYLGAFVTPNDPSIMRFLRTAADYHPEKQLKGYQANATSQVKAIFEALKKKAEITYVDSVIAFNPEDGSKTQRIRLPRQSLEERQANCIDGTVLFASLLEGISMNPAIVVLPGHALVGWETGHNTDQWEYLETTEIGTQSFDIARDHGKRRTKVYQDLFEEGGDSRQFRRWSVRKLRTDYGVTPME